MKRGFSLSEVLITLGIIGGVAALTLPTVITNYQKQATVNKLKKFYTNMNQILMFAQNDNGDLSKWENSEDFYNNYIKPYIKNVDKVQTNIHVHGDFQYGLRFIFADGTQAILSASTYQNHITGSSVEIIYYTKTQSKYTDIDSLDIKQPTRERFYFVLGENGNLIPPHISNSRSLNLSNCKKAYSVGTITYGNNGHADCSTLIYKDGWRISDDYPW